MEVYVKNLILYGKTCKHDINHLRLKLKDMVKKPQNGTQFNVLTL